MLDATPRAGMRMSRVAGRMAAGHAPRFVGRSLSITSACYHDVGLPLSLRRRQAFAAAASPAIHSTLSWRRVTFSAVDQRDGLGPRLCADTPARAACARATNAVDADECPPVAISSVVPSNASFPHGHAAADAGSASLTYCRASTWP